jgi:GntR family transcriptional regulator
LEAEHAILQRDLEGLESMPTHSQTPVLDLGRSSVARYIQLMTLFRSRIESGAWRVGDQIPTVDDLAAEYGVARATIRQALGALERDGLIERFRAKGTFVRQAPTKRLWCDVETDWSGLLRSREGAEIEVLEDRDGVVAEDVPESVGTRATLYRHVRRRHWRDGEPFLLADIYLDQRLSQKVTAEDLRSKTALKLVASIPGVRVADARQTLTIGGADVEAAGMLKLELNAPVAFVQRAALDAEGGLLMLANGIYRGDIVRIDMKLKIK